jgi:predicted RNA binding protein YcfA (HicA-like mRNA interferase family)
MTKLPEITGKDLISALSKFWFQISRINGSHHILKHKDRRITVV